jgi:hypothetical protein
MYHLYKIMDFSMIFSYMYIVYFDHIYPQYPLFSSPLFSNNSPLLSCLFEKFYCFYFFIIILLYWGYTVTFTKALAIYHNWIHPLHHSFLYSPSSHSWNSLSVSHFFTYIHEYIFPAHSSSYTLSFYPPPLTCSPSPRTCFTFLFSVFQKKTFLFV